ncbi:MAG: trehalose-phosphatase [Pseudomonadota bacterium]
MHLQHASPPPPARPDWAYFLDVDGTLIDLAATPASVHVDGDLLALLQRLQVAGGGALALISGRSLADLAHHLPGLAMPMAGQHGLERRDGGGRVHRPPLPAGALDDVRTVLGAQTLRFPALLLEDKGMTLALHYRQAPFLAGHVHQLMARLAKAIGHHYTVQKGKYVAELKPAGVDKGTAIAAYLSEPPFADRRPVFIGDDANDEQGFARVNLLGGLSIKVGPGPSCATHRLADVGAVRDWLGNALETTP